MVNNLVSIRADDLMSLEISNGQLKSLGYQEDVLSPLSYWNTRLKSLGYQNGQLRVPKISKRMIEFLGMPSSLRMKSLEHTRSYTESQVVSNLSNYKAKTSQNSCKVKT